MAARGGLRLLAEGIDLFITRPDQTFIGHLQNMLALIHRIVEGHAVADQPIEMRDGLFAVEPDLRLVRLGRVHHQVGEHVLNSIFNADRVLNARTAPQVKVARGHAGHATTATRSFEDENVRPCITRRDCRANAGAAESYDDHIGFTRLV